MTQTTPPQTASALSEPNPAIATRPERSSKRVAHRGGLAWLPWLLLGLLALLLGLCIWAITEVGEHEGSPRTANPAPSGAGTSEPTSTGSGAAASGAQSSGAKTASGAAGLGAAALVGGGGAAAEKATGASAKADVAGTVLFAESSAAIDANGKKVIAAAADAIRSARAKRVVVDGYTDVVAGQPVNKPLSVARATNTAHALHALLGNDIQVTAAGLGERNPVASNSTANGRLHNRRAEIHAK